MVIKKSLFVLLKHLMVVLVITIIFIVIFGLIGHSTGILSNVSHEQLFLIDSIVFIIPSFVSFIAFLITTLRWKSEIYTLEDNLLVHKHGILNQQLRHFPLENIESLSFKQNILGKAFNYGTIYLIGSEKHKNIEIKDIDNPIDCYQYLKKIVNTSPDSKFEEMALDQIIKHSEDEKIEFKSSLRWDFKQNKVNKALEKTIMKTVAGFMNSGGGSLVIGIDDNGQVLGLANDFNTLQKRSADGLANCFTQIFDAYLGLAYRYLVKIRFEKIQDKDISIVYVSPSKVPIYLKDDQQEEFYVRTGNSTNMLNVRESNSYISLHWN